MAAVTATKLISSQRSLDPKLTRRKQVYIQDPAEAEENRVITALGVADGKGFKDCIGVLAILNFNTPIIA